MKSGQHSQGSTVGFEFRSSYRTNGEKPFPVAFLAIPFCGNAKKVFSTKANRHMLVPAKMVIKQYSSP
ncbi:MAG: hypothetical protein DME32_13145 [Verrucomicrobia bacterium]|nr:MAG: hypothetical protein DME32_13145 [Verrucomicrobiota bacterium]